MSKYTLPQYTIQYKYCKTVCEHGTCDSLARLAAFLFLIKVVSVGVTAAVGEVVALPLQRVVVPAAVTRPTRSGVGGF